MAGFARWSSNAHPSEGVGRSRAPDGHTVPASASGATPGAANILPTRGTGRRKAPVVSAGQSGQAAPPRVSAPRDLRAPQGLLAGLDDLAAIASETPHAPPSPIVNDTARSVVEVCDTAAPVSEHVRVTTDVLEASPAGAYAAGRSLVGADAARAAEPVDPAARQGAATQPAATPPAASQPGASQPATSQPGASQPGATPPAAEPPLDGIGLAAGPAAGPACSPMPIACVRC